MLQHLLHAPEAHLSMDVMHDVLPIFRVHAGRQAGEAYLINGILHCCSRLLLFLPDKHLFKEFSQRGLQTQVLFHMLVQAFSTLGADGSRREDVHGITSPEPHIRCEVLI